MLVLIRGISGSGKSTLAKTFESVGYVHLESDMYMIEDNVYTWKQSKIEKAHQWCFSMCKEFLSMDRDVVVANTFTRPWELKNYTDHCNENNITYKIVRCSGNYENVHNVSGEIVAQQKKRFEDIEGEELYVN